MRHDIIHYGCGKHHIHQTTLVKLSRQLLKDRFRSIATCKFHCLCLVVSESKKFQLQKARLGPGGVGSLIRKIVVACHTSVIDQGRSPRRSVQPSPSSALGHSKGPLQRVIMQQRETGSLLCASVNFRFKSATRGSVGLLVVQLPPRGSAHPHGSIVLLRWGPPWQNPDCGLKNNSDVLNVLARPIRYRYI